MMTIFTIIHYTKFIGQYYTQKSHDTAQSQSNPKTKDVR